MLIPFFTNDLARYIGIYRRLDKSILKMIEIIKPHKVIIITKSDEQITIDQLSGMMSTYKRKISGIKTFSIENVNLKMIVFE